MLVFTPAPSKEIIHGKRTAENLYTVNVTKSARAFPSNLKARTWDQWHRTFRHMNVESVKLLKRKNMVSGLTVDESVPPLKQCEACIRARQHILPFPKESHTKYENIGDMTFSNVWGPSQTTGINGIRYFVSFTDAKSRYTVIYFMKKKSETEEKIKQYTVYIKTQAGKTVKCYRLNNGGKYIGASVKKFLADEGIRCEFTAAYSPQQNGVSERLNRMLVEHASAMLQQHSLPPFLWPEALAYTMYLKNCSPTRALQADITPDKAFWNKKPDISALQEFGIDCWVL